MRNALPSSTPHRALAVCSAASAVLLAVLVTLRVTSGVSQQWFEAWSPPAEYAAALVAGAGALRRTLFVDDIFIAAYTTSTVLFVAWVAERRRSILLRLVLGFGVAAGLLDLIENHHILAMLRVAEGGVVPSSPEIAAQMVASSLKWVLGHIAFAMIGVVLEGQSALVRGFRASLVAVQLPLGVLAFTATDPGALEVLGWARYANVFLGFAIVAYLTSRHDEPAHGVAAIGSGEPA